MSDDLRKGFDMDVESFVPTEDILQRFPLLSSIPIPLMQLRFSAIRLFNAKVTNAMPFIDFSHSHLPWSLAHSLMKLKGLLFLPTKLDLWNIVIASTNGKASRLSVSIDRPRAMKAKERGDPEGSRSVFGQLFRQLHFQPPAALRKKGQIFSVEYKGEGGQDAGRLFFAKRQRGGSNSLFL